jgi:CHAT domain-containing protein/tetratricopeptide (TPR) repeat protein
MEDPVPHVLGLKDLRLTFAAALADHALKYTGTPAECLLAWRRRRIVATELEIGGNPALLLPFTVWLLAATSPDTTQSVSPAQVVLAAVRAIDGDSSGPLASRWQQQLARDSSNSAALLGLATLARLRYDYPRAEQLYQQLLQPSAQRSNRIRAYAALGLAQGFDAQGWSAKAGTAYDDARRLAQVARDSSAEGEALLGISLQRAFATQIENGLAALDTAAPLIPASRADLHTERLRQRGALRGILGRPDARADIAQALEQARKSGMHRALGVALKSLAQVLQFEGKRDSSSLVLRQAEDAFRRGHDRAQLSTTLLWHVNALLNQGDLGDANELAHVALKEGEAAGNLFGVGAAYTALGALNLSMNDLSVASDYLDKAIALFQRLGDPGGEMKARDYLAVTALAAGDIPGARREAKAVLAWYQRNGDALIQFSGYRNLAIIAMHERDWAEAARELAHAHGLARRMNRPLWSAELAYDDGRLALFRGDVTGAERSLKVYLATLDTSQHVFRHDARVRLADAYAREGDLDRAEREAREAWDELDRWRATLSNADLRVLAFQASPTEMSDRDASVVSLLAALAAKGHSSAAFELAERRRARELADRLAQAGALDPSSPSDSTKVEPARGRVSAADASSHIPDDSTAILEYVTGSLGAPTTLFILTRATKSAPEVVSLPPVDSLSDQILRLEGLVQSGDSVESLARSLGTLLLEPAVGRLDARIHRLVIVPDGPLHRLPFAALRLANGRYAAERYAISLAPSTGVLLALWARPTVDGQRPMRLLAFGDPIFPESDSASGSEAETAAPSRSASRDSRLPRLRRSADEARLVARFSPSSVVRLGENASATYLKQTELAPYRVIHFATHTLVDEHTAARSALVLAPGPGESGFVGPEDLARLHLNADLVVLSSCRSAGGVLVNGEGLQGLTAPLLQAGARSVLATQWEIGDQAALDFIRAFYRRLAEGTAVGEALRLAKLDRIGSGAPARDWAAFTMLGDPTVRIPLRRPRPARWPWMAGLLVLAAAGGGYWLLTRNRRSGELR